MVDTENSDYKSKVDMQCVCFVFKFNQQEVEEEERKD